MRPLDYASPRPRSRRPWVFWIVFFAAYLPGLMLLGFADDVNHRRMTGHPGDGTVVVLGLYACPVFACAVGVIQALLRRCATPWFAAAFAVLAPLITYSIWVAVD